MTKIRKVGSELSPATIARRARQDLRNETLGLDPKLKVKPSDIPVMTIGLQAREENLRRLRNLLPHEREEKQEMPVQLRLPDHIDPEAPWTGKKLTMRPGPFGAMIPPYVKNFSFERLKEARWTWFNDRAEELLEFFASRANWAARRIPGDGTTHTDVVEFFTNYLVVHGQEPVTVRGLAGYPDEFEIEFEKLGTFGAQLEGLRAWVNHVRLHSADGLPDVRSDDADAAFGTVLGLVAESKLLPEVAAHLGWPVLGVGQFMADYTKKYPDAKQALSMAYDMGLQSLTAQTADDMATLSAAGKLTNQTVAVMQARLSNYRALGTRLAGSSYSAPAAQRNNVNIMPAANGGMRIDLRFSGDASDVVDVLDFLPGAAG